MFYVDVCRKCMKPEVRPEYSDTAAFNRPVLLNKVSLDGGNYVLKLCHECRETTTIAELEFMKTQSEEWFTDLDIEVTLKRTNGETLATIKDRLTKKRTKRRR